MKDFFEWNLQTDSWSLKSSFIGSSRSHATGFSIANTGYVGTDTNGLAELDDFFEFNDEWSGVEEKKKANNATFFPNPSNGFQY